MIEQLVEQIEARFADAQREMSDPEIFADRNRAAAAGRAYRQLEPAAKLAEAWRRAVSDVSDGVNHVSMLTASALMIAS